jgi:hypothetical protein
MGRIQTILKEAVTASEALSTSLRELQEILGMGEPPLSVSEKAKWKRQLPPLPRKRKAMRKLSELAAKAKRTVRHRTSAAQRDADIKRVLRKHEGELITVPQVTRELGLHSGVTHLYSRFGDHARYGLSEPTMQNGVKAWRVLPASAQQEDENVQR